MRRTSVIVLLAAGGLALALGAAAASRHHSAPAQVAVSAHQPAATGAPSPDPTAPAGSSAPADLRPAAAGSERYAGIPAILHLELATGDDIWIRAVMSGLHQMSATDLAAAARRTPALAQYAHGYRMQVTMTVLAATHSGTGVGVLPAPVQLGGEFRIAAHPGSDPLLSSSQLSTSGCSGLPASPPRLRVGQPVTWCVHGFASAGSGGPIGGEFVQVAGPYASPVIWATRSPVGRFEVP